MASDGAGARRPAALVTNGLSKRYGRRLAVDALSLEVPSGVVAGFIGPNGAGKTTTMAMLLGRAPDGRHGDRARRQRGRPGQLPRPGRGADRGPLVLAGPERRREPRVLSTLGGHDASRIPEVLDLVGLGGRGSDRFGQYSFGMKQRLGIAAALLGD